MELFVVNRYRPEGDASTNDNAENLRQSLLEKIEERRSKRKAEDPLTENGEAETKEEDKPKRKRKKKRKFDETLEPEPEKEPAKFLVLGKDDRTRNKEAKSVLPDWLKNAEVVSVDLRNLKHDVDSVPLDPRLIETLKKNKVTHFFPVQAQVIPCILKSLQWPSMFWPRDICVSAPTGSGKTLAFVLPLVHALQNRLVVRVRALVVLPVQDLAKQVFKVFQTYCASTSLKVILLSNALSLQEQQSHLVKKDKLTGYRSLVDIIVTTPGRLVDHIKATEGFSLRDLKFLVIDEADRVMEGVQNDWLYHLNVHMGLHTGATKSFQLPPLCLQTFREHKRPPQKLLFSATLSQDPEKLQQLGLFHPRLFTSVVKRNRSEEDDRAEEATDEFVGKYTTPAELTEMYVKCTATTKPLILVHLLKERNWKQVLCFTRSRESARRLVTLLRTLAAGIAKVSIITATLSPTKRNARLKKFASGEMDVLVCSDALARGIDIPNVQCVVSYDMPKFIKNHVHRVGRSGRAGQEGLAVTFVLPKELTLFKRLMETGKKTEIQEIEVADEALEPYEAKFEAALKVVKKKLDFSEALKKRKVKKIKRGVKSSVKVT